MSEQIKDKVDKVLALTKTGLTTHEACKKVGYGYSAFGQAKRVIYGSSRSKKALVPVNKIARKIKNYTSIPIFPNSTSSGLTLSGSPEIMAIFFRGMMQ